MSTKVMNNEEKRATKRESKSELPEQDLKLKTRKRPANNQTDISKSSAKKKKSSEKERVRNLEIKKCLEMIRYHVPYVEMNLSKIRTLRLASEYINHLQRILNGEMIHCELTGTCRPLLPDDFKHVVMKEMQITNSYKERAEIELSTGSDSNPQLDSPKFENEQSPNSQNYPICSSNYEQYVQIKQQTTFPSIQFSECKLSSSFYQFV